MSQLHRAGIIISSGHQLSLTKERSTRLCRTGSLEGDKTELKSTHISISTCHQSPVKQKGAAQNAALLAFQQLRRQVATKKAEGQRGGQLTPPEIRKQAAEDTRSVNSRVVHKPAQDENVDIGNPSTLKSELGKGLKASQANAVSAARAATSRIGVSDKLAVWHPEPSAEKEVGETGAHIKAIVLYQRHCVSSKKGLPTPGRPPRSICQIIVGMAQGAWLIVEPVSDPKSSIRKRFERGYFTGEDVGLFVAAALFMVGMFLAIVAFARVVGIGLQTVRAFGAVFRLLTGS
jgi:hypothetical protein